MSERRLLFLCTGNYYRSRFAEEYWNARAEQESLAWRADSRALADPLGPGNPGTMSAEALAAIARLGIEARGIVRSPLSMRDEEFALYARVISPSPLRRAQRERARTQMLLARPRIAMKTMVPTNQ